MKSAAAAFMPMQEEYSIIGSIHNLRDVSDSDGFFLESNFGGVKTYIFFLKPYDLKVK